MIPLRLRIRGFLSYREPAEIDFTPITLACISGPNGAGKSSLLDAITWALFGQARRRDDALINLASDEALVHLEFAYEENIYRVRRTKARGKSARLEFAIRQPDGEWKLLSERQMRETQRLIEQTLRMDYDLFVNASFFLQNQADHFARLSPARRKEVLGQILGLAEWDRYREMAALQRRLAEDEIQRLEGRLSEIRAEIEREAAYRETLRQQEALLAEAEARRRAQEEAFQAAQQQRAALDAQRRLVEQLRQQREQAQATLTDLQARFAAREAERQQLAALLEQAEAIRRDHRRWEEVRRELDAWEEKAARFLSKRQELEVQRSQVAQERARLEQEQASLRAQAEEIAALRRELDAWQAEAEALAAQHQTLQAQLAQRAELEAQRRQLQDEIARLQAELARTEGEGKEHRQRKEQLESLSPAASQCPLCGQPLTPQHRQQMLADLEATLEALRKRFQTLKEMRKETEETLRQVEAALADLAQTEAQERALSVQLERLQAQIAQAQTAVQHWEAEGAPRLAEVTRRLEAGDYAPEARQAVRTLEAELQALGYDPARHEALRREEQELRAAASRLAELEQAQGRLETLTRALDDLRRDLERQEAHARQAEAAFQEAAARLAAAEAQLPDLDALEAALIEQQMAENRLREEVAAARQRVAAVEQLKASLASLEEERAALARRVEQYKLLEQAFGRKGVPALLIEQALPQIEAEANALLDRLSDGNMQIRFVTQRPYKDKRRQDLKETLDIQISDRYGIRDYEMYSGGEAFRVNFAIRVALAKVLARRAGARLQTLVIDEGFGSQDAQGRQRIVEAIHAIRDDFAKILVITHIEELKDAFPYRIEVSKTPNGSRVAVIAQ